MDTTREQQMNGARSWRPYGPDAILYHHAQSLGRIEARLDTIDRRLDRLELRRKRIEDIPQWVFWAWGCAMLVLTKFSPEAAEAIERVAKLAAAFR